MLVGEGPDRSAIENKVRTLGLMDNVVLLGHRNDVPALLGAADIYVHYSSLENCPVVLLEAGRAALPVAAIPAGGVPESSDDALIHANVFQSYLEKSV